MTYKEQLQSIANRYAVSGEPWPASARQIAAWAIREGLWHPQPSSLITRCADEIADAIREEYMTDPQGRTVRVKHAASQRSDDGPRQMVWADIRTATRDHMAVAFQLRRGHILGECRQLKADVDSFNENRAINEPIQLVLDFTDDVAELEAIARARASSSSAPLPPWRRFPNVPPPRA
jgi:hypothetical protein